MTSEDCINRLPRCTLALALEKGCARAACHAQLEVPCSGPARFDFQWQTHDRSYGRHAPVCLQCRQTGRREAGIDPFLFCVGWRPLPNG